MKRWIGRALWLLAWSFWLWCGFGLYRELPKDLGPIVCRLPMNPSEDSIAFLHDRHSILTTDDGPDDRLPLIRLRNERTGEVELEVKSEGAGIPRNFGFINSFRHGFHGRCETVPVSPLSTWPVFVLDLLTGEWRKFDDVGFDPGFHRVQPWVMFSRSLADAKTDAVVILDLKTGRRVFDNRRSASREPRFARSWHPFFIGDAHVGIPVKSNDGLKTPALEVWSIHTGEMIRRLDGIEVGEWATGSPDGKISYYDVRSPYITEVYDSESGRRLLAIPPEKHRILNGLGSIPVPPVMNENGSRILTTPAGGIFEIATGAKVWAAADHEFIWSVDPPGRFEVRENWKFSFFGRPVEFNTFVVRRLDDGAFISRSKHSTLSQYRTNLDGTLFLEDDETVRELPVRVNWLYLSLAQGILALPLILLWTVLHWRRKRRLRLTSVTP